MDGEEGVAEEEDEEDGAEVGWTTVEEVEVEFEVVTGILESVVLVPVSIIAATIIPLSKYNSEREYALSKYDFRPISAFFVTFLSFKFT